MTDVDLSYFYNDEESLRPFSNFQSEISVKLSAELCKGNRDHVVKQLFEAWQESRQWAWLDDYNLWLARCEDIDQYNEQLEPEVDLDGNPVQPDYAIKPDLPVRPIMVTWEEWVHNNYEMLRQYAYPTEKEQLGMQYDDQLNGTNTWFEMQVEIKKQYPKPE